ncbi:MAG: hypothetical protein MSA61_02285 [Coriobacteriaceae bacterium]|nr:hypothetical protein [Coriobacteriaceae bacterium]
MLFGRRKRMDLARLPLEELRFSTEDLFVLLNGFDGCAVVVNPFKLRLDLVEERKPERNEWRRAVVERYAPSGWVDGEANPNPELARALAALGQMGVSIADGVAPQDRTMGVTMGAAGACGVVRAPGGGWHLRPFPDDRSLWPASFRELFAPRRYPFRPASEGGHSSFPKKTGEGTVFAEALVGGDEAALRALAARKGADPEPLVRLSTYMRKRYLGFRVRVTDMTEVEPSYELGWRWPGGGSGKLRLRRVTAVSDAGAMLSDCNCWHEGVSLEMQDPDGDWGRKTSFATVDFYPSGDLFSALLDIPDYPGGTKA